MCARNTKILLGWIPMMKMQGGHRFAVSTMATLTAFVLNTTTLQVKASLINGARIALRQRMPLPLR